MVEFKRNKEITSVEVLPQCNKKERKIKLSQMNPKGFPNWWQCPKNPAQHDTKQEGYPTAL